MMFRQVNNRQYKLLVQEHSRETVIVSQFLETIYPVLGMMRSQKGPPAFNPLIVITGPRNITITAVAIRTPS